MKYFFLMLLCASLASMSFGQRTNNDSLERVQRAHQKTLDSLAKASDKKVRYFGIQANLLLQQFISFNSNASINTNPYVFCYTKTNKWDGNGFALGTGLNASTSSSDDGITSIKQERANVAFRFGYEKKYLQHQKLIPFWGVDLGLGYLHLKTESRLIQTITNNNIITVTDKAFFGPSFRAGLNYAFSKHILIGTDFFFNLQVAYETSSVTGNSVTPRSSASFAPINIGFQVPTALYLMFRF
jgi:hypothetical protein